MLLARRSTRLPVHAGVVGRSLSCRLVLTALLVALGRPVCPGSKLATMTKKRQT